MITTASCIVEIVKTFSTEDTDFKELKNWKRMSKKIVRTISIRKFYNKITGDNVTVTSMDEEEIFLDIGREFPKGSFFDLCKYIVEQGDVDDLNTFIYALSFANLPRVEEERGMPETLETIDFENTELLEINSEGLKIAAGGDWQDPVIFTAKFKNNVLYCDDYIEHGYPKGITDEQFLDTIYNGRQNVPEDILQTWHIGDNDENV
jgi:hypothetical protein